MTTVKVIKNKTGTKIGFEMEGHVGYATRGYDILCASLSSIYQLTLIGLLRNHDVGSDLFLKVNDEATGHCLVLIPKKWQMNIIDVSFIDAFSVFVQSLVKQYPDFIKYKEVSEGGYSKWQV